MTLSFLQDYEHFRVIKSYFFEISLHGPQWWQEACNVLISTSHSLNQPVFYQSVLRGPFGLKVAVALCVGTGFAFCVIKDSTRCLMSMGTQCSTS